MVLNEQNSQNSGNSWLLSVAASWVEYLLKLFNDSVPFSFQQRLQGALATSLIAMTGAALRGTTGTVTGAMIGMTTGMIVAADLRTMATQDGSALRMIETGAITEGKGFPFRTLAIVCDLLGRGGKWISRVSKLEHGGLSTCVVGAVIS